MTKLRIALPEYESDDRIVEATSLYSPEDPDVEFITAKETVEESARRVANGQSHRLMAGSVTSSSQVIKAALKHIGLADGIKTASSCFLMSKDGHRIVFADAVSM